MAAPDAGAQLHDFPGPHPEDRCKLRGEEAGQENEQALRDHHERRTGDTLLQGSQGPRPGRSHNSHLDHREPFKLFLSVLDVKDEDTHH